MDYIKQLCQANDFVLLQEHWYHNSQASVFETEIETRPIASENRCKLYPPEENSPKPF